MNNYELIYIVQADLDENAINAITEKVDKWIVDGSGTIVKTDRWGKRRLAYQINKRRDGFYVYQELQLPPASVVEIERNLRLTEQVMRYSIINKSE
ncbi:MAG TPA: 30S ribosomal protein S6 [Bellilinea sp.]|nr:30S ribosomal protein S6 [Bellilinea sp.]